MTENEWNKQLRQMMDGLEKTAPELDWTALDDALCERKEKVLPVYHWTKQRRWSVAAAVALIVIGIGGWWLRIEEAGSAKSELSQTVVSHQAKEQAGEFSSKSAPEPAEVFANVSVQSEERHHESSAPDIPAAVAETSPSVTTPQDEVPHEMPDIPSTSRQKSTPSVSDSSPSHNKSDASFDMPKNSRVKKHTAEQDLYHSIKAPRLLASAYLGNAVGVSNYSQEAGAHPYSDALTVPQGSPLLLGKPVTENIAYHHDLPIVIGVQFKYALSKRWHVSAGVNYSYLRSTFSYSSDNKSGSGVQKLHYVGVPVSLSYTLWQHSRLQVYLSAGVEADQLVSGNQRTSESVLGAAQTVSTSSIDESRLQWMYQAAAGISYQLGKDVGVFVEPHVRRYLDNHSNIQNIYHDKPCTFGLNVGLSLRLN